MRLSSSSFEDGGRISGEFAFAIPDPVTHVIWGGNKNPEISWFDVPADARSLVLICHDPDVPSKADDVNQEGRIVPADLPRVDFYHWLLVDLDPAVGTIAEGAFSSAVTARGKAGSQGADGSRSGVNSYTDWFAGDADMGGDYYGYDGPCPPWNDSIVHNYIFTLYALNLDRCPAEGRFTGADLHAAIDGHIVAQASIQGTYSLNPDVG